MEGVMVVALATGSERQKSCLTNSGGEYEIRGLSAQDYMVTVGNTPYVLQGAIAGAFQPVEVKDTGVNVLDLQLAQGGVITGCIEYSSKQPVVQRQVIYEKTDSSQGASPMSFRANVGTDDRGCFRIYGLPEGQYRVGVGKPVGITVSNLPLPFPTTYYPGTRLQSDAQTVGVIAAQERDLGKLVVKADLNSFFVGGVFVDREAGEKLASFPFEVARYEGNRIASTNLVSTDQLGTFVIENLPEGRYRLQPAIKRKNAGYTFTPLTFEVVDKDIDDLVVRANSATAALKGEVLINGVTLAGNQDCSIALQEGSSLNGSDASLYRVTLDRGQFNLSGLAQGTYTLVVIPLRSSLRFEQSQVGRAINRDPGPYGLLHLNLIAGNETVKILLNDH
jgi:hypothetical protein